MAEAKSLIEQHVPAGGMVVTDRAMTIWAHPRTLQFQVPERQLLMPEGSVLTRLFHYDLELGLDPKASISDTTYYICPNEVTEYAEPISKFQLVDHQEHISLYRASAAQIEGLLAEGK